MNATDIIAYTYDASVHCQDCAELAHGDDWDGIDSEGNEIHPMFSGAEVDCSPDTCDDCGAPIDGQDVLHNFRKGTCEHCGAAHDCEYGEVQSARLTGNPYRACECGAITLDLSDDED